MIPETVTMILKSIDPRADVTEVLERVQRFLDTCDPDERPTLILEVKR